MNIDVQPGKYVVAVSGGVDSMVLLDLLVKKSNGSEFFVAHYDHGIRGDSAQDFELVEDVSARYKLKLFSEQGKLGPNTSEDTARQKRYVFLNQVKKMVNADAILTAHHEDDLIEDIIIHDQDADKYCQKFILPWFEDGIPNQFFDNQRVRKFLYDIIQQKDTYLPIARNKFKRYFYYPVGYQVNMLKVITKKIIKKK